MKKRSWTRSVFSQSVVDLTISDEDHDTNQVKQEPTQSNQSINALKSRNELKTTNWVELFRPKSENELALHPKKLLELKQFFEDFKNDSNFKNKAKVCLITGPTGSGKTAAVRVIADLYQFELMEWINPLDQNVINSLGDQHFGESYVASGLTTFKSFLHQASRYRTLAGLKKRLLLVEDFPNVLLKEPKAFEEILTDYHEFGNSPIVFIVSDSKSRGLNISYNLFPEELRQKLHIIHISFNPIANTIMQKAMKNFCALIRQMKESDYKLPSQHIIDSIVTSAQGDIRNALINFHFASLKGAPEVSVTAGHSSNSTKKSKTSKKQGSLQSMGRDESCTMLHALGRVFNPKFTTEQTLIHSPEVIASDFSTEPTKFLDFLQANYLAHFSDIDHVVLAIDCLSAADVLLKEYRTSSLSTIGLNIATRGLMIANSKPVNGWLPVRGPKRFRPGENMKPLKILSSPYVSRNLQALDFQPFKKLIESKVQSPES